MSQDFYDKTKFTGVAHVVVASGTNVTFVAFFLIGVLNVYMPRKRAIPFAILGIILYLFVSGFEAPLIRAAIMAVFTFWAEGAGRLINTWRVLLVTAGFMLIYNPDWIFDIGFLLSFASTTSIVFFKPKIDRLFEKLPHFLNALMKGDFSTTIAAQIGTTPILFITFGQFNPLSPLINVLVLWTIAPLMIIGSIGGIVGLILPSLGRLILYFGFPLLWWFVRIIEIF